MKRIFLLLLIFASPSYATHFYTSSTGSDTANNCQTLASPCNLANGLTNELNQVMADRGDIIDLCAGACDGSGSATLTSSAMQTIFYNIVATSYTGALTIKPYSTGGSYETITIQYPGTYNGTGWLFDQVAYIIIGDSADTGRHLIFDGINGASGDPTSSDGFSLSGNGSPPAHHIRIVNTVIENFGSSGIQTGVSTHDNEFLNLYVYANGRSGRGHGIYICGGIDDLIQGGDISYNDSCPGVLCHRNSGIQTFCDPDGSANTIIENVDIHHNGIGLYFGGIGGAGTGQILRNNIIRDNVNRAVEIRGTALKVYNNTMVRNTGGGYAAIGVTSNGGSNHLITNNIIYGNYDDNIVNSGSSAWTDTTNLKGPTNPLFTDYGGNDFTLASNSPAINNGTDLTSDVPTDKDGTNRPQGCCFDIGAYEVPGLAGVAFFNARTQRFTTSTFAAGALGGGAWGQVGSGLTVNGDGSNQFTASARATPGTYNDGIARELTYTAGGGYSGKLYCKVTVVSLGSHNDATDSLGCGFPDVNGTGPIMRASVYAGTTYLQIQKDVTGAYSSLITQIAGVTIVAGDTLAMEWNGATGEFWAGVNTLYYISPIDHTYDGLTLKPSLVATGDAKGDVADFGDILVGAGCVGCAITVTGPGSGTVCISGQTCAISWTTTNISGTVDVYYLDAGGSQHLIASPAFDASPYSWTVNAPASTLNKIRVTQSSVSDDSDAAFTVLGTKTQFR